MKPLKGFAYIVIILALLCGYSYLVYDVSTKENHQLGSAGKSLLNFSSFPKKIQEVLKSPEVKNTPEAYLSADPNFETINKLDYNLYGLTSFWNNKSKTWEVKLLNLKNDSVHYQWTYKKANYSDFHYQFPNARLNHSILLPNKSVIVKPEQTTNLTCLDSNSNVVWVNRELRFHHAANFDADGNIYMSSSDILPPNSNCYPGGLIKNLDGRLIAFREDYITKIDPNTGEILYHKAVSEIFTENNLKGLLYDSELWDPIHMNDIQPVLEDGEFWKKDDLFLSIRESSMILLYRPSTNEVIKIIYGPFVNQHDVDIISDHEVSLFNNNYIAVTGFGCAGSNKIPDSLNSSEVIIYNFKDESFKILNKEVFLKENIKSNLEGESEWLSNGHMFIEENNTGRYFILDGNEVVMRKVLYTPDPNFIHLPNWMRIYEELPF